MAGLTISTCGFSSPLFSGVSLPTYTFVPGAAWGHHLSFQGNFWDSEGSLCNLPATGVKPYLEDGSLNTWNCDLTILNRGLVHIACPLVEAGQYTLNFGEHEGFNLLSKEFILTIPTTTRTPDSQITQAPNELRLRAASTEGCDVPTTTSSSVIATPTTTNPACPDTNGYLYVSQAGTTWNVTCYQDYQAGQIEVAQTINFAGCIEACAKLTGCVAAAYTGGYNAGFCYLKNQQKSFVTASNVWGVVLAPQPTVKARDEPVWQNVHARRPWGEHGARLY